MLNPINKKKLMYIVVGTGRCGTVYFAKLLTEVGIPCSHERIFTPLGLDHAIKVLENGGKNSDVARWSGLSENKYVLAEASYMAVPYLDCKPLRNAKIIHVVRNPIDVVLSFNNKLQYFHNNNYNKWEQFILSHMPEIKQQETPLIRNAYYVVKWNRWIEKMATDRSYIRIKLEHDTDKLLDFLSITKKPNLGVVNAHEKWRLKEAPLPNPATRQDVLNSSFGDKIKSLMKDYGYEV